MPKHSQLEFTNNSNTLVLKEIVNQANILKPTSFWIYDVTGDVSNKYIYIFAPYKNEVRALY